MTKLKYRIPPYDPPYIRRLLDEDIKVQYKDLLKNLVVKEIQMRAEFYTELGNRVQEGIHKMEVPKKK